MRRFIIQSLPFLLGLVLIFGVFSIVYSWILLPIDNFSNQISLVSKRNISPRILILGDSHAAFGISPAALNDDVLNFSYPSSGWEELWWRLQFIERKFDTPSVVLLPAEPHFFTSYRSQNLQLERSLYFDSLFHICMEDYCNPLQIIDGVLSYYFPIFSPANRSALLHVIFQNIHMFIKGDSPVRNIVFSENHGFKFGNEKALWSGYSEDLRLKMAQDRIDGQFDLEGVICSRTSKLFNQWAKEKGIKLIGIRYPVTNEYNVALTKSVDMSKINKCLEEFDFDSIIDYSDMFADNLNMFYDSDHVTFSGAILLTENLMQDLNFFIDSM